MLMMISKGFFIPYLNILFAANTLVRSKFQTRLQALMNASFFSAECFFRRHMSREIILGWDSFRFSSDVFWRVITHVIFCGNIRSFGFCVVRSSFNRIMSLCRSEMPPCSIFLAVKKRGKRRCSMQKPSVRAHDDKDDDLSWWWGRKTMVVSDDNLWWLMIFGRGVQFEMMWRWLVGKWRFSDEKKNSAEIVDSRIV